MNILFISQYFHPEQFSNTEIAKALVERDHDVEVVCCVPNYPEGKFYPDYSNSLRRIELWNGIRILRARTVARGKRPLTLLINYLVYPMSALATIVRRGRGSYSVSFTSMPSPIFQCIVAVIMKVFRNVPAVYWVQDIWPESLLNTLGLKSRLLSVPLRACCAYLYRSADIVLVQSEAFRSKLEAMGVEPSRIAFFPNTAPDNFVPLTSSEIDPAIASLLPPVRLRLMFAGNIGESQNLDILVAAAERLRGRCAIQWVIVGSGRDADRIKCLVASAKLEDEFIFAGRHPMDSMPSFYALADAMIVSLKDTEIFHMTVPYKLQTYLSAGKPIIGSISGETRRIIEAAEIGYCADAEDLDGFCDVILQFAASTQIQRMDMATNAQAYFAQHYSADTVYDGLTRQLMSVARPV